eukprot:CAMPEP_0172525544 /NCGR_PEP_ID=MMETSP1067-20121228/589_1 /TAXON_ID=265564 ORGANISM="Thalassiosira punctigera, Strain Tpunct2005C2" /NCGR_SAMPLE_ID=MMETSP1067 /ASSEMBLY_ACC=CAM_ASM_000444 /LENGTH=148 /DNA_ID=CAMNT_0013308825 /DNA_START=9 /DNA_END=452 /DNA_ORIENTATION=-
MTLPSKREGVTGSPPRENYEAPRLEDEDEWSKISSTAKIGETIRVPVEVFERRNKPARELDVRDMRKEDLESLRTADPFMYYSIPGVRAAEVAFEDVDYSDVNDLCRGFGSQVSFASRRPRSQHDLVDSTKVARRSCISFECDMTILL